MRAVEIVTIGTELMLGHTIDTNGGWIGSRLAAEGFSVSRRTTVSDDAAAMKDAIAAALGRSRTVICTGGLGPTTDDFTKAVVADLYGRDMVLDEGWFEVVKQRFVARGIRMPDINRNQAEVPAGSRLFHNDRGSAPGIVIEDDVIGTTILLPGVPFEMRGLMEDHVIPYLRTHLDSGPPIIERWLRTIGIAESAIAERVAEIVPALAPLAVSFLPSAYGEDIRITCWGDFETAEAERRLADAQQRLAEALEPHVYAHAKEDLAEIAGHALRERGLALALAESCTGGLLAQRLTNIPGSSEFFLGGIVSYANAAKTKHLRVRPATLLEYGAVSEQCVREMAAGALQVFEADVALAITGVAGPGGGTEEKPVGTVWIGIATLDGVDAQKLRFGGDRAEIRTRASQAALALLMRTLH
jgi:nicotinamide-nucleotide amidase